SNYLAGLRGRWTYCIEDLVFERDGKRPPLCNGGCQARGAGVAQRDHLARELNRIAGTKSIEIGFSDAVLTFQFGNVGHLSPTDLPGPKGPGLQPPRAIFRVRRTPTTSSIFGVLSGSRDSPPRASLRCASGKP